MTARSLHAVTGAFGYSGRVIAEKLLSQSKRVVTLTNSPHKPNPFGNRIEVAPFHFDAPEKLEESLREVDVLYNTYWIRFNHRRFGHEEAVRNSKILFAAAKNAGVRRIVHTSIANPCEDSDLEYYRGKAVLERALKETGISYAILRPTVLFGRQDILVNNIAWMVRHLPVIGVFGDGRYGIRPIHVDDFAELAIEQGEGDENTTLDAVGPESFSYVDLVRTIRRLLNKRRAIVSVPPSLGYVTAWGLGVVLRDVVLTWPEIQGLMRGLLDTQGPPTGHTRLTEWIREHADTSDGATRASLPGEGRIQ